jgi:hypothetical protein
LQILKKIYLQDRNIDFAELFWNRTWAFLTDMYVRYAPMIQSVNAHYFGDFYRFSANKMAIFFLKSQCSDCLFCIIGCNLNLKWQKLRKYFWNRNIDTQVWMVRQILGSILATIFCAIKSITRKWTFWRWFPQAGNYRCGKKRIRFQDSMFWDRCYDFLNIFAEKFSEKIGVFESKQS